MELFGAPTAGKVVTVIFACLLNGLDGFFEAIRANI
jgi:hypothetical protein